MSNLYYISAQDIDPVRRLVSEIAVLLKTKTFLDARHSIQTKNIVFHFLNAHLSFQNYTKYIITIFYKIALINYQNEIYK